MRYTGIANVGERLVALLKGGMTPETVRHPEQIGLCEPQETGDFAVGVWLYDIRECLQLNRHEMVTIDSKRQKYPSVYVNLYYMITARSLGDIKYRAKEEAMMLGKILQTMKDAAVLDFSDLEDADGGEPVCQIVLQNLTMEEKLRIYHVPDGCYKTSLFYEIGPLEISSEKERSVQRVTEVFYELDEKE
ncbi:MAG: DUF4255 domain-containing protein [Lachnospiraceae bacterium]|nr:DUF4255 domain-containing protein [Lachnospiraceae bacterium]